MILYLTIYKYWRIVKRAERFLTFNARWLGPLCGSTFGFLGYRPVNSSLADVLRDVDRPDKIPGKTLIRALVSRNTIIPDIQGARILISVKELQCHFFGWDRTSLCIFFDKIFLILSQLEGGLLVSVFKIGVPLGKAQACLADLVPSGDHV